MKKNLIFQRVLACIAALLVSVYAKAGECTVDGIKYYYEYTLEQDANSYHLNALVKVIDGKEKSGVVTIPAYITVDDNVRLLVTVIGASAFEGNTKITRVIFSGGISHIYGSAFKNCTALEDVTVGTPSEGMPSDGLTYIEDNAFENCTSLKSINLPNSLTKIGDKAFQHCEALTSIDLSNGIEEIGEYAFNSCYNMKSIKFPTEGFTTIGNSCFRHCTSLESITIPGCVRSIDHYCFRGCTGLKTAIIELGAKTFLGDYLFDGCTNLIQANISSYNTLLSNSFRGCTSLKTVVLNNMTEISSLFENCTLLESVSIPNTVKTIASKAFKNCSALENISLPSSVTTINGEAFMGCSSLKHIAIPEGVTTLPKSVFEGCSSLETISLPSSLTEIGNKSLWGCSNLTKLDLPSQLKTVKNSAFVSCRRISSLIFPATLTTLEPNAFYGCKGLKLIDLRLAQVKITNTSRDSNNSNLVFRDVPESTLILMPGETFTISDPEVKRICLENWDSDKDGELSAEECMAVTDLGTVFKENQKITSFNELEYFTGLTTIGDQAFWYSKSLKSVRLPETVTVLGNSAFGECQGLEQVTMPAGIKTMGNQVFAGCKLASVTLPNALESINYACFTGVPISSLHIPSNVNYLNSNPFEGCNSLESITVDEENTVFYSPEGSNAIIMKETKALRSGCKTTVIPSDVEIIDMGAFAYIDLTSIDIPESVTRIRTHAFLRSKITNITIPKSVSLLEKSAFFGCKKLTDVTVNWEEPIAIEESTFSTRANAVLHVPLGCKAAYEAAEVWKDFKEISDDYTEGGVTFASKDDGTLMLSNADNTSVQIRIPSTLTVDGQEYSVTGIGESAFENDETLETVSIPGSIAEICEKAFAGCKNLLAIFNYGENPADLIGTVKALTRSGEEVSVAAKVFAEVDLETCELYVPAGCSQKYKAAEGWNEFKNIIEMIKGDANGDKKVNAADVVETINAKNGKQSANFIEFNADIDGNGEITDADVQAISNIIMGIEISGKALSEATNEDVGSVIASDGNVYPAGTIGIAPIAMIVYVGDPGTADKNSSTYRGLAIALSDDGIYTGYDQKKSGPYNIVLDVQGDLNGLSCPWNKPMSDAPEGTSGWFIPSSGQFYLFLKSLEMERHDDYEGFEKNRFDLPYYYSKDTDSEYGYLDEPVYDIVTMLRKAGDLSVDFDYTGQLFWSCTYNGGNDRNYYLSFNRGGVKITYGAADAKARFRPFLAF